MSSTKKIIRKKRGISKRQVREQRETYIEYYKEFNDIQLLEEAKKITSDNLITVNEKENRISALKHVVDDKLFNDKFFSEYIQAEDYYYPDTSDKEFNKKIFKKKEFYINKILTIRKNLIIINYQMINVADLN
jgi:hypothetical protein